MAIFKRNQIPHLTKGKWHKVFLESDGSEAIITTSDIEECAINGLNLYLPHDLNIKDIKFEVNNIEFDTGACSFTPTIHYMVNGTEYISLPMLKGWDYMTLYIFAERR